MKCPSCGQDATGKFCSACGAALAGSACATCGAPLSPGARFCHVCGTPVGGRPRSATRNPMLPWIAAAVGGALVVVLLVWRSASPAPGGTPVGAAGAMPGAAGGAPATTDLSTMTPREQADRLFDRVMRASEGGNRAEVSFFGPMALQAYAMLGPLDADARFHVGLIEAALDNAAAASAQADSLERETPGHLFIPLLRWEVANRRGDTPGMQRAYRQFLDRYDREIATGKSEYDMHRTRLQAFRDEARGAIGAAAR